MDRIGNSDSNVVSFYMRKPYVFIYKTKAATMFFTFLAFIIFAIIVGMFVNHYLFCGLSKNDNTPEMSHAWDNIIPEKNETIDDDFEKSDDE